MYHDLLKCTDENTTLFGLTGLKCIAKVTSVESGDTLNIVTRICGQYRRFNCRMEGYECVADQEDDHMEFSDTHRAQLAKSELRDLVENKLVHVTFNQLESVTIATLEGKNINNYMIRTRLGVPLDHQGKRNIGLLFTKDLA